MSDIEKLFVKMQSIFGGDIDWKELDLQTQLVFVSSVNNIQKIATIQQIK